VKKVGNRFNAVYDHSGVRYNLGRFDTVEGAVEFREKFVLTFSTSVAKALALLTPTVWASSSTGIRGVTKMGKGFVVRKTVDGQRVYLGHSTSLDGAIKILEAHNE